MSSQRPWQIAALGLPDSRIPLETTAKCGGNSLVAIDHQHRGHGITFVVLLGGCPAVTVTADSR